MAAALACPNCQGTNVARVEAVLQSEPRYISSPPYGITVDSPILSILARPTEPKYEEGPGISPFWGWTLAFYILGQILVAITLALHAPPSVSVPIVFVVIALWATGVLIGFIGSRATRKDHQARKAAVQTRNAAKRQAWQRAVNRWDRCWYCPQCGSVYIQDERRAVPAKHLADILYQ